VLLLGVAAAAAAAVGIVVVGGGGEGGDDVTLGSRRLDGAAVARGWRFDAADVDVREDGDGFTVTIDGTASNPYEARDAAVALDDVALLVDGDELAASAASELPVASPGAEVVASIVFEGVVGDVDDAVLLLGRPGSHRASLPLGDGHEPDSGEPVDVDLGVEAQLGDAEVLLVQVRAAPFYEEGTELVDVDEGTTALVLTLQLGGNGESDQVRSSGIALVTPGGEEVGPTDRELTLPFGGDRIPSPSRVVFEVPEPASGTYTLRLEAVGGVSAEVDFEV
jgi:hypothetical protein